MSASSIGTPAVGENPYEYYAAVLVSLRPSPPDRTGLRIRLVVIFVILAYTFCASIANFAVHLYANRLKDKSFWVFRLVRRQGGTHIVSNHFVLSGMIGLVSMPLLAYNTAMAWSAFLGDGWGFRTMEIMQFVELPVAYTFGWLLSWATFQAFMQVEGGRQRSRFTLPAWLENSVYLGGLILFPGCLVVLAAIASIAVREQWSTYFDFYDWLVASAASWTTANGSLSTSDSQSILEGFSRVSSTAEDFYTTAQHLAIAGAILPALLLILNGSMLLFVRSIRRQVSVQLSRFTTVNITRDDKLDTAHTDSFPHSHSRGLASPVQTELGFTKLEDADHKLPISPSVDFIPLKQMRNVSFAPSRAGHNGTGTDEIGLATPSSNLTFFDQMSAGGPRTSRAIPTRGKIRAIAGNSDKIERHQAERLMSLMKAEQELLVMCLTIFSIALCLIGWCAWSIPTLRDHANITWGQEEGLVLFPVWMYSVLLAIAETFHALVEWRHLRPWRSAHNGTGSNGTPTTSLARPNVRGAVGGIAPGGGVVIVPAGAERNDALDLGGAVRIDVQVVTQHETADLTTFGRGRERRGSGVDEDGLGGGDEKAHGRFESLDDEEVWSTPPERERTPRVEMAPGMPKKEDVFGF
ncbi:hypothetical protein JCM10207_005788 [Rhodosporidiobolus poonsookiae]